MKFYFKCNLTLFWQKTSLKIETKFHVSPANLLTMKVINASLHPKSLSPAEFDDYLAQGWYRMYQYIFSVSHLLNYDTFEVDRVWWLRYPIHSIQSHRSHQKIRKKNSSFEVRVEKFISITAEDEELYKHMFFCKK